MVELLSARKRELLKVHGTVTAKDFEVAWSTAWAQMVSERAWPHATEHRRQWRLAMNKAMKPEARACFLGEPTAFQSFQTSILNALDSSRPANADYVHGRAVA